jgi:hypothetical protein
MAKTKSETAPAYEPGIIYDVAVTRPFTFNGHKHLPRHEHQIEGATLTAIIDQEGSDVVRSAKPIQ